MELVYQNIESLSVKELQQEDRSTNLAILNFPPYNSESNTAPANDPVKFWIS